MQLIDWPHGSEAAVRHHELHDIGIDAAEALQSRDVITQSIAHYVTRRDEFFIDNRINTNTLRDIDIIDVIDEGDGLFHAVSLSLETCQDVGLGVFRHSDEGVDALDAFFLEHVDVTCIGVDYQRVRQHICQLHAAVFIDLHDLDIHIILETLGCDTAHTSATDNHHVADVVFLLAAHLHQLSDGARLGDDIDHVAGFQGVASVRDECRLTTMYRNQFKIKVFEAFGDDLDRLLEHGGFVVELHHIHLDFAACEVVRLGSCRLLQQGDNLLSSNVFRRDDTVDAEVLIYSP